MGTQTPSLRLVARCEIHPTYSGYKRPSVECEECKYIFHERGSIGEFSIGARPDPVLPHDNR